MARKRYHYPLGLTCEYPHQLPRVTDVEAAQRWIVSLQRDLAALHGQLDRLLAAAPPHEDFQVTTKLLGFNMAKIDAVQTILPTMHRRINQAAGKAASASGPRNFLLPEPTPVEEPQDVYTGIEYVPSKKEP